MKTKHHLIVALVDAGIPEMQAIDIAADAFRTDIYDDQQPHPKDWLTQEIKKTEDDIRSLTTYKNALDSALNPQSDHLHRGAA